MLPIGNTPVAFWLFSVPFVPPRQSSGERVSYYTPTAPGRTAFSYALIELSRTRFSE
jgi:hypothetical protein